MKGQEQNAADEVWGRYDMEWTGIRLYKAEAECVSDRKFEGIAASLDITGVQMTGGGALKIDFTHTTKYQPGIATIRFCGFTLATGKKAELDSLVSGWKKDRFLPKDVFETLVNLAKYSAETNGVLVAKALNIAPPLVVPRVRLAEPRPQIPAQKAGKKK